MVRVASVLLLSCVRGYLVFWLYPGLSGMPAPSAYAGFDLYRTRCPSRSGYLVHSLLQACCWHLADNANAGLMRAVCAMRTNVSTPRSGEVRERAAPTAWTRPLT